jgi:dihydrodipicolinate synthase/N-acetylneuraminate lyase
VAGVILSAVCSRCTVLTGTVVTVRRSTGSGCDSTPDGGTALGAGGGVTSRMAARLRVPVRQPLALAFGRLHLMSRLPVFRPIAELTAVLFRETNPVPLKQALALLGVMAPAVRLPLVKLNEPHRIELSEVLFRLCHEHAEQMIGSIEAAPVDRRLTVGQ